MKNYTLQIKLLFEYYDDELQDVTDCRKYTFDEFQFCDEQTQVRVTIQQDFMVCFEDVMCDSIDEALLILNRLLPNICESLSLIIQIETGENLKYQPNLSYNISDVQIIQAQEIGNSDILIAGDDHCKKIFLQDTVSMHESLTPIITRKLSFEYFQVLYDQPIDNKVCLFRDTIYRAIRCRDVQSKYFTLFTMIEFIEDKYKKFAGGTKILEEEEKESLIKTLKELLRNRDSKIRDQLVGRVSGLLSNATLETRSQKLWKILSEKYGVKAISKSLINYDITEIKMKEFVDRRNSLFHGGQVKPGNVNNLVQLCNELLFLCLEILKKEIEWSTPSNQV